MTRASVRDSMLEITCTMIDEVGEAGVRLERILELAEASPSSLYHHFGNLRGLVEEAQMRRFINIVSQNLHRFSELMKSVTTREELCDVIDTLIAEFSVVDRHGVRFARANALGSAFVRDDFLKRLGEIQRDTIKSGAIHLNELKVKGIVREDFDTHGSLAWFDSLFFGRIVVEITDDDELLTRWDTVAREVVYVSLFGADGFALAQRTK